MGFWQSFSNSERTLFSECSVKCCPRGMLWVNRHCVRGSWTILMRYFLREKKQKAKKKKERNLRKGKNS
jgi:hypothetical protein